MRTIGEQLKLEGMEQVRLNSEPWHEQALSKIRHAKAIEYEPACLRTGEPGCKTFIGEDIRQMIIHTPVGEPHHPNAWGALIRTAREKGYIVPTGKYRKMKLPKSHARETPEYRWG